jgi:hypothetical protein
MMRNIGLALLLVVVTSGAAAEWVKVSGNETMTNYADPATIRKTGNVVKMWQLYDYQTARAPDGIKPYRSIRAQSDYDCKDERTRLLSGFFHSGNMAVGEIVYTGSDPGAWAPVPAGSGTEKMWKIACGKR